jgi:hypothetical protein
MLLWVRIVILGPEQNILYCCDVTLILEDVRMITWDIDSIDLAENIV